MKGKLIVVEGTDCSGKETQTEMLIKKLNEDGIKTVRYSCPFYDTPTGKIIAGPYLGKETVCSGWFKETAVNVDAKVASLYYAADRKYNIEKVIDALNNGVNVILDRYVYSNMAHQGGKIETSKKRDEMFTWLENLEFELLELPVPDIKIFLHMPYEQSLQLKAGRKEKLDEHEKDKNHLLRAEQTYFELVERYDFKTFECVDNKRIKTIDEINEELYNYLLNILFKEEKKYTR